MHFYISYTASYIDEPIGPIWFGAVLVWPIWFGAVSSVIRKCIFIHLILLLTYMRIYWAYLVGNSFSRDSFGLRQFRL